MPTGESILVLGTGELGIEVLRALAGHERRASRSVTVLLRPSQDITSRRQKQLAELASLGVSYIEADVANDDQSILQKIFGQHHTVIGCTGMTYPAGTQLKLAKAIISSKVQRYLPWQFGVDYDAIGRGSSQDLFSEQLDVRDLLRGQKATKWVIISTGLFMSFLFEPAFGIVNAEKTIVTALGAWDNQVTTTAPQDIGRVVAEVVWSAPALTGVIYTAGATISYAQVADAVAKAQQKTGSTVHREVATIGQLKDELRVDPQNGLKKYRVVFAEGRGVAWDEAVTFNRHRGMKLSGIDEWLVNQS